MTRTELAQSIAKFIAPSENVSGEVAEGLKLLRLAAVELAKPVPASPAAADHNCLTTEAVASALAERDRQIDAQDKLITAILEAAGVDAQDVDDLPASIAQGRSDLDKMTRILTVAFSAAQTSYNHLSEIPVNALETIILNLKYGQTSQQPEKGYIEPDTFLPETSCDDMGDWISKAIDLSHAVAGDLSPANRVMARYAEQLILTAPQVNNHG